MVCWFDLYRSVYFLSFLFLFLHKWLPTLIRHFSSQGWEQHSSASNLTTWLFSETRSIDSLLGLGTSLAMGFDHNYRTGHEFPPVCTGLKSSQESGFSPHRVAHSWPMGTSAGLICSMYGAALVKTIGAFCPSRASTVRASPTGTIAWSVQDWLFGVLPPMTTF